MQLSESSSLIDVYWFTQPTGSFGIITILNEITNERKAYIGAIRGENEDDDIRSIYEHGAKLLPETLESIKKDLEL